jgi:hypothetical protein
MYQFGPIVNIGIPHTFAREIEFSRSNVFWKIAPPKRYSFPKSPGQEYFRIGGIPPV